LRYIKKQILKNLLQNKGYITILFLLLLFTSFTFYFVQFSIDKNKSNFYQYLEEQNVEDFKFQVTESNDEKNIIDTLEKKYNFNSEKRTIQKVEENNINYFFINQPNIINQLQYTKGSSPSSIDEIVLSTDYLTYNQYDLGDKISINNMEYTIAGSVHLPDYQSFMPFGYLENTYENSSFAITHKSNLQNLHDNQQSQTYYSARFEDRNNISDSKRTDMSTDENISLLVWQNKDLAIYEPMVSMESNQNLSHAFLILLSFITLFVFYQYIKNISFIFQKEFGLYKALGYKNRDILIFILQFGIIMSVIATLLGFFFGYIGSELMIDLMRNQYGVPYLERGINNLSFLKGTLLVVLGVCAIIIISTKNIRKKESADLLSGHIFKSSQFKKDDKLNNIIKWIPKRYRPSARITFKKGSTIIISAVVILSMTVIFLLSSSLFLSSGQILKDRMTGLNYNSEVKYSKMQTDKNEGKKDKEIQYFLKESGYFNNDTQSSIYGLESTANLLNLVDRKGNKIDLNKNDVVINESLEQVHGYKAGDIIKVQIDDTEIELSITNVSKNGDENGIFLDKSVLANLLEKPEDAHNGFYTTYKDLYDTNTANELYNTDGMRITTLLDKEKALENQQVSNRISSIINQVIGVFIGGILIYMSLLMNFEEKTSDILILHRLGYKTFEINKLLIDVYKPLYLGLYIILLPVSLFITKQVHILFSILTQGYIPFTYNIYILIGVFIFIAIIYQLILLNFNRKIKKIQY